MSSGLYATECVIGHLVYLSLSCVSSGLYATECVIDHLVYLLLSFVSPGFYVTECVSLVTVCLFVYHNVTMSMCNRVCVTY